MKEIDQFESKMRFKGCRKQNHHTCLTGFVSVFHFQHTPSIYHHSQGLGCSILTQITFSTWSLLFVFFYKFFITFNNYMYLLKKIVCKCCFSVIFFKKFLTFTIVKKYNPIPIRFEVNQINFKHLLLASTTFPSRNCR